MNVRSLLAVGALAIGLVAVACGDGNTEITINQPQQTGIAVTGSGSVTVVPDIAVISIGVEALRETVAEAREDAARAESALRETLTENGIEEQDISTQFFNIFPQYRFTEERGQEIIGYMVSNQLSVKVRDIDNLSDVIDDATEAAGDLVRVNNVSFTVDEPEQFFTQARQEAMDDARERAEQLAELAGVTLGNARSISESSFGTRFATQDFAFGGGAVAVTEAATGFSPGEQEVSLTVSVVYDIE